MADKKNLTLPERVAVLKNSVEFGDSVADTYRAQLVQDQLAEIANILAEIVNPPKAEKPASNPKPKANGGKAPAKPKEPATAA